MDRGWIKLYRKIWDNPLWEYKPYDKARAWIDIMLMANHSDKDRLVGSQTENVKRGCLIVSEKKLMERWGWSKNKVRNFLDYLEKEKMIERNTSSKRTNLNLVNYSVYQDTQTTNEPQMDCKRTTNEPPMNHERAANGLEMDCEKTEDEPQKDHEWTVNEPKQEDKELYNINNIQNEEAKEVKKEKKDTYLDERKQIIEYLNQRCGSRYSHSADYVKRAINARLNENHTVEEFYEVIDKKYEEWQGTDMEKFLRPQTLFGTKFENYLSQPLIRNKKNVNINRSNGGIDWDNV